MVLPSILWGYLKKVGETAECNECKKAIASKGGTTTGMTKHLETHKNLFEELNLAQNQGTKLMNKRKQKREKLNMIMKYLLLN